MNADDPTPPSAQPGENMTQLTAGCLHSAVTVARELLTSRPTRYEDRMRAEELAMQLKRDRASRTTITPEPSHERAEPPPDLEALMARAREGKEDALNEQLRQLAGQQVAAREAVKAEAAAHHKRTRQEHEAADRIREALADYVAKDRP